MVSVKEASSAKTELASDLDAGVQTISLNQEIKFGLYVRVVLPLDGYVFWLNANLMSNAALIEANIVTSQILQEVDGEESLSIKTLGSLHFGTDIRQEEQENYAANRMIFTSEEEVTYFNQIAPNLMWIGEFEGMRFGFSSQSSRYKQAGLWHYVGFAIYADMDTQIINQVSQFSTAQIVSNSLPAWLAMNNYKPIYGFGNPGITLYPSFLSPNNLAPPFATVHIDPSGTRALASAPTIDSSTSRHTQLCAERVRVTLWGANNAFAMNFFDMVYQYSSDVGTIGIMNMPVPRDEKRTQTELVAIAQKKVVEYEISYLQQSMRNISQQLITSVVPTFYVNGKNNSGTVLTSESGAVLTSDSGTVLTP